MGDDMHSDETETREGAATLRDRSEADDGGTRRRTASSGQEERSKLRRFALPMAVAGAAGAVVLARRRSNGEHARTNGRGEDGVGGLLERGMQVARGAVAQVRDVGGVTDAAARTVAKARDAIQTRVADDEGTPPETEADGRADGEPRRRSRTQSPPRDPRELEEARRERQARREERRKRAKA
jgi:hypothetical protein